MEHNPEVMRICVLEYFKEIKRRKSLIEWSRNELDVAKEGIDALKAASIGCEIDVKDYRDKTSEAYSILTKARESYAMELAENLSFLAEAGRVCDRNDYGIFAVCLKYMEGKKWGDISQRLGYSVGHLKTNVAPRGFKKIYERMPEEFRKYALPDSI